MDIKQQILHFYRVEGLSLREISRRAGVDRKTVMRLINDYEAAIKANPETGVDDFLASRPKYSKRAYAPFFRVKCLSMTAVISLLFSI